MYLGPLVRILYFLYFSRFLRDLEALVNFGLTLNHFSGTTRPISLTFELITNHSSYTLSKFLLETCKFTRVIVAYLDIDRWTVDTPTLGSKFQMLQT